MAKRHLISFLVELQEKEAITKDECISEKNGYTNTMIVGMKDLSRRKIEY